MLRFLSSLLSDLESEPTGPRFRWRWVVVPICCVAVLTVFVRLTNFDEYAQAAIYRAGQGSWALGDHPFWKLLYDLGTIPTTVIALGAVVGFFLSWSRDGLRRWRRVFIYLLLVAAVGPGIITNAILKEYWGRPRPREVEGMGGHNAFEEILTINTETAGKSFPCGHATMGFYFLCGFFLLRRYRKNWADAVLVASLILGGLMGIARMLQGAHFFSDVIWAGGICWFTAMGLYYAMRLDRGLAQRGMGKGPMPLRMKLIAGGLGVAILAGILLASPYRDVRNFYIVNDFAKEGPLNLRLKFVAGEIDIVPGEVFHIEGEAYGHGVPTSNISENYVEVNEGDIPTVAYVERMSGFLTEANQQLTVTVPWERIHRLNLEVENGRVWIRDPSLNQGSRIQIVSGNGEVTFVPEAGNWKIREKGEATITGAENLLQTKGKKSVVVILEEFSGQFSIEKPKPRRAASSER